MKTKTKNVKEISNEKVITKTKKELEVIDNATTKILVDQLKERQTEVKDKNFLYKFQLSKTIESNAKIEKSNRNKIRRNLTLITNKIIVNELSKDKDKHVKQTELIKEFINFYKETYILNDFSLKSLTNKQNEDDIKDYKFVLNLCKESLTK